MNTTSQKNLFVRAMMVLLVMLVSVTTKAFEPLEGDVWDDESKTLSVSSNPGENAYKNQTEIVYVVIQDGVTEIGAGAFQGCTGLTDVSFNEVTSIGECAFQDCSKLNTISLDKVTSIGECAFKGCLDLTDIELLRVKTIGNSAFQGCLSLTSFTLPYSLTSIGVNAFQGCTGMENVYCYADPSVLVWNDEGCDDFKWPKGENPTECHVFSSKISTFQSKWSTGGDGDVNVKFVDDLPPSVTPLEGDVWDEDTKTLTVNSNPKAKAYYKQTGIIHLVISNGVTKIGKLAFGSCTLMTSATIPTSVTTIEQKAFFKCEDLKSITIPANVTTIEKSAFDTCTGLTSVIFAEGSKLATIDEYVFKKCKSLSSITIPASVTTIGKMAFNGCTTLASVIFAEGSKLTTIKKSAFAFFCGDHFYINVPVGKELTVNGKTYTGALTDNKADIISYLFKNLTKRTGTPLLTLAMTEGEPHNIIIDKELPANQQICETFYVDDDGETEDIETRLTTQARAGETVVLSWGGWNVPENHYVSGFTFNVEGVEAKPNENDADYTFIMPACDVEVTTVLSKQEKYTIDLTDEEEPVVVIPESVYILMNTLMGYFSSTFDPGSNKFITTIDLNLDGTPDLQLTAPIADEELDKNNDEYIHDYTVRRLAGVDAVTKNYCFTPYYPFPYPYNKILVKLNASYEEEERPFIVAFDDESDNSVELASWKGKTVGVMLGRRTLKANQWNSLCLPFSLTKEQIATSPLAGATIRSLESYENNGTEVNVKFADVEAIEAGKPYIVRFTGSNLVEPIFLGVTVDAAIETMEIDADTKIDYAAPSSIVQGEATFKGTYGPLTLAAGNRKVLFLQGNKLYYPNDATTVNAFRAYFEVQNDVPEKANEAKIIIDWGDEDATAIEIVDNGKLTDDSWWTLTGVKLEGKPTESGIYIHNGKKVVVQ